MQSPFTEPQPLKASDSLLHIASIASNTYAGVDDPSENVTEPTQFCSQFVDYMELYADAGTVAQYLNDHAAWFHRCAHPMKVEAIGANAYALVIGRFGSFGYEVEPKIGLDLLPPDAEGVYRIETVPVPDYESVGYEVDFRAVMKLVEMAPDENLLRDVPEVRQLGKITSVQWQLDLTVQIQFPRFIHALPKHLIQSTGDKLLRQIVRQVSNRLTRKVQEDFCKTYGVPLPRRTRKWFFQKADPDVELLDD